MRINVLFEMDGEYMPFNKSKSSAHAVGSQLARVALEKIGGNQAKAQKLAQQLASRFLSDVNATIDEELGYQQQSSFDATA